MNRKQFKKEIRSISIQPDNVRKEEFLDSIFEPDLSVTSFLASQIRFIKVRVWLISSLLFFLLLIGINGAGCPEQIWPVSAVLPFVVLIATNEINRSERYRMQEMELASVFSAKAALMARVFVIGIVNILILLLSIPVACAKAELSVYQAGFYMMCPYCLSACLNLLALCRIHGENANYVCMALSGSVSVLFMALANLQPVAAAADSGCFLLLSAILAAMTMIEGKNYFNQMEELTWS